MADLTHKAGTKRTIDLITTDDDGAETTHPFQILRVNKPLMDKLTAHGRELRPLQERAQELEAAGDIPAQEELDAMETAMVEMCDLQLRSLNGPVTIQSLWEDGSLAAKDVRWLVDVLKVEAAGNPPA
jgi:hypothetical protein